MPRRRAGPWRSQSSCWIAEPTPMRGKPAAGSRRARLYEGGRCRVCVLIILWRYVITDPDLAVFGGPPQKQRYNGKSGILVKLHIFPSRNTILTALGLTTLAIGTLALTDCGF